MEPLKLVSVNVERSKHLGLVLPFLESENADVVCVQEFVEGDIPRVAALYPHHAFARMQRRVDEAGMPVSGVGIFTKVPLTGETVLYYDGSPDAVPDSDADAAHISDAANKMLLTVEFEKDGAPFRIATTHFTWSLRGMVSDEQRRHMAALLNHLSTLDGFVLCGDFNAPRGGEIFARLAEKYTDNIPSHYATSIDANLHRNGKIRPQELADKMVDGLFTTPGYAASDVRLVPGVSDHYAIVAKISKTA